MDRQMFGINIKAERAAGEITQRELAERMSLSRNMIDKLENGRSVRVDFTRIKKLSECLECDIASLLVGTGVVDKLFEVLVELERQGGVRDDE